MKFTIYLGLAMAVGLLSAHPQTPPSTQASPAAAEQVPDFWRVPALNALVVLNSSTNINPAGVSNVSRLVIRDDLPLLRGPDFQKVVAPYLWQPMTEARMKSLQQDTILFYRSHNRPLVDVFYPEQVVDNGNLQVVVLEGKLKEIRVQDKNGRPLTNGWTSAQDIRNGISLKPGAPILESKLNSDLDWLNRNPFRRVDALYKQGADFGESDLVLHVDEQRPFKVFAGYEDSGSRLADEERILAGFNWGKAFGLTDNQFGYQFIGNPGLDKLRAHSASYAFPLPWRNMIRVFGSYVDVKGDVGNGVTLEGNSYQASMRYEMPLPFLGRYQHQWSLGVDYKYSENNIIFGVPSAFNTPTEIFQLAAGYSGVQPDPWGQTGLGAQMYYSPGGLTDKNSDAAFGTYREAKAHYFYTRLSAERATKLPITADWRSKAVSDCFSWDIRALGQVTTENLLPSEQLGLGGYATARGYEEREANADQGWVISNELRTPSFSILKFVGKSNWDDHLQLLAFWDYGRGYPKDVVQSEPDHVTFNSVGPGVRYSIGRYFALRFDYGWQLTHTGLDIDPVTKKPFQDSRGHIGVQVSF